MILASVGKAEPNAVVDSRELAFALLQIACVCMCVWIGRKIIAIRERECEPGLRRTGAPDRESVEGEVVKVHFDRELMTYFVFLSSPDGISFASRGA